MAKNKKMTDDEVMEYAQNKMFGDLDSLEAGSMFKNEEGPSGMDAVSGTADNAKPASSGSGGVKITVEPIMDAAQESGKPSDTAIAGEEKEDKLKGIGKMSPMMARIHGER